MQFCSHIANVLSTQIAGAYASGMGASKGFAPRRELRKIGPREINTFSPRLFRSAEGIQDNSFLVEEAYNQEAGRGAAHHECDL